MWLNTRSHLNMTVLESYAGGILERGVLVADTTGAVFLTVSIQLSTSVKLCQMFVK